MPQHYCDACQCCSCSVLWVLADQEARDPGIIMAPLSMLQESWQDSRDCDCRCQQPGSVVPAPAGVLQHDCACSKAASDTQSLKSVLWAADTARHPQHPLDRQAHRELAALRQQLAGLSSTGHHIALPNNYAGSMSVFDLKPNLIAGRSPRSRSSPASLSLAGLLRACCPASASCRMRFSRPAAVRHQLNNDVCSLSHRV